MGDHWTYEQRTGRLITPAGTVLATGYSGHGAGLNNPDAEALRGVGPIPRGLWKMDLHPHESSRCGHFCLSLTPDGFDPHGRSAFLMHGDNQRGDHSASDGCIIMPLTARQAVSARGITALVVVAG